ncbi:MAG: LptF/LptG family permease [Candidatus Eisenbacteria bacterium]|uniref:LptF/LptG family permease n=1 Tax=Eiseniibacteriota bacterium TaxID=2212470 RepID=A0A9D6QM97_UNCEI|nr:LptF/LptG family permease [Candidatus Eisenbacteria bacterium]MBI3539528.1 LptF/LptG family permease [Candidatus Eisenbacteria bacterium]
MRILHSYILRLHVVPFLLGFGVVTFILVMDVLFDYLDLVLNRGVAVGVVLQLFVLSLGYIVALSAPCAVLVAVLMTFGRLSQDNEITALRAIGVNMASILVGPVLAALALTFGLTLFNNHVLPESNHAFANLLVDIGRMRPTVKLQEGVFITDFPGYNMLVQSVNGRTNEMRGITIYQLNPGGPPTTILAKKGFLSYTRDGRTAVLELKDGEIHDIPAEEGASGNRKYRRLLFKTHVINIAGAGAILERSVRNQRSDREMSARELIAARDTLAAQYRQTVAIKRERFRAMGVPRAAVDALTPERVTPAARAAHLFARLTGGDPVARVTRDMPALGTEIDLWRLEQNALERRIAQVTVEVHKKFSLPFACVVFVLVGAPLGMRVRRAGPAVAFISIGFFLFYWLCLVGGEELATRLLLPPWLAMWLPNIVLGAIGIDWTLKACEIRPPWTRRAASAPPVRAAAPA